MNSSDRMALNRLLLFLALFLGLAESVGSQAKTYPEYAMKAAFIYNFTLFTRWPELNDNELRICTLQSDRLKIELDQLISRQTQEQRTIIVEKIAGTQEVNRCHVVFLSEEDASHIPSILMLMTESPILAVTDIPGLTEKGAIIGMNIQNQRIVFEVNLKAAQQSTLQLSSKLLNLAARVYQ